MVSSDNVRQQPPLRRGTAGGIDTNGLPTDESISEEQAAQEEFRAAEAEVNRITEEIRSRKALV